MVQGLRSEHPWTHRDVSVTHRDKEPIPRGGEMSHRDSLVWVSDPNLHGIDPQGPKPNQAHPAGCRLVLDCQ